MTDRADGPSEWSHVAEHDGVRLHYLDPAPGDASAVPVLFVPGFGEEADEHVPFVEALAPRRTLVVDLRGRGRSDVPAAGYRLGDHVADVDAVVRRAGLDRLHLVSYSRGTSYAMAWALEHPEMVASYVIGDYPARQIVPPEWFARAAAKSSWRGRPITERMPVAAIAALLADAVEVELWDRLPRLACPTLLVRGVGERIFLDDETVARYRDAWPGVEVVTFTESGHDLWDPDPTRFARTVRDFVARVGSG